MPKRSNLPEKILSILFENPSISREEIRNRLGVSYQSVQKHLLAMQQQNIVAPSFTVIESKIKRYLFWVFILTNSPHDEEVEQSDYQGQLCNLIIESFSKENELVEGLIFAGVDIVIGGSPDIILRLFSDNPNSVGRFVTRFIRAQPTVVSTSTAWSLTKDSP